MGPEDEQRAATADALLSSAWTAARHAGVTRLADVTRLDRIGLPVWQAIRPASRALSVHQGKGASTPSAQLGALLEAVESDAAERFDGEGPVAAWADLPSDVRPIHLDDFARNRAHPPAPDMPIRWVSAEKPDGSDLLVPFSCVSLDFTIDKDSLFDRASAGVATGSSRDDACRASLLELVERDAVSRFEQSDSFDRLALEVATDTVHADWFGALLDRLSSLSLRLRLFAPPSPTGMPVIMAAVSDPTKTARPYDGTVGHAAHPDPDIALFQAIAEALQSRLTFIAGAREDCWPWLYLEQSRGIVAALAPPPAPGIDPCDFRDIGVGPHDLPALIGALEAMGCREVAFVTLARPEGLHIVRGFAPGLGSLAKGARL